jgi:hypothetical protein
VSVPENPYVGPRAFQPGETLYGRRRELDELRDLLIAERILLLYSPSGAGKTSLIQAALLPALAKRQFNTLPIARVSGAAELGPGNRYSQAVLRRIAGEEFIDRNAGSAITLSGYLRELAGRGGRHLLVFDQFEEILTADASDQAGRAAFFDEVAAILREPNLFVLFAMREDYIAGLDPYRLRLPTQLRARMRLGFLDHSSARAAMQKPAEAAGIHFPTEVANQLVDDLRRITVHGAGEETRLSPYVEPLHLQIVCLRLWDENSPRWEAGGELRMDLPEEAAADNVTDALGSYYDAVVARVASGGGEGETLRRERAIRDWFERYLITTDGVRSQVLVSSGEAVGLTAGLIRQLVDAYLVRAEDRGSALWYELAHDRLVGPVRRSNARWYAANLAPVQRQAQIWQDGKFARDYLLTGSTLDEARIWADHNDDRLTQVDRDFLTACRDAREQESRDLTRGRLLQGALAAVFAVVIIAGALWLSLVNKDKELQAARREAGQIVADARATGNAKLLEARRQARFEQRIILANARAEAARQDRASRALAERQVAQARLEGNQIVKNALALARLREGALTARIEAAETQIAKQQLDATIRQQKADRDLAASRLESAQLQAGLDILRTEILSLLEEATTAKTPAARADALRRLQETATPRSSEAAATVAQAQEEANGGLSVCSRLWAVGQNLRIRFLDGDPALRGKVMQLVAQWSSAANIRFVESNDADAEVRVTFRQPGSWSFIGTDALLRPRNEPTMNLGAIAPPGTNAGYFQQVVLHEFGHVLGLIHEHQNPNARIPWDMDAVYAYFSAPPNSFSRETIESTVVGKARLTGYRAFDPDSIMVFAFPRQVFKGDFGPLHSNQTLSASDKAFVARLYPRSGSRQC